MSYARLLCSCLPFFVIVSFRSIIKIELSYRKSVKTPADIFYRIDKNHFSVAKFARQVENRHPVLLPEILPVQNYRKQKINKNKKKKTEKKNETCFKKDFLAHFTLKTCPFSIDDSRTFELFEVKILNKIKHLQ